MNKEENAELAEARRIKREAAKEAQREIAGRMVTTITTALAIVAALFWQTAISDTIKTFIPVSGAWSYEIVVALLVTAVAATAAYLLTRPAKTEAR
jgi:drug/metabolite transporter (DMT)-like permease